MEYEKWWEWYWDNDKTIIVLGDERDKKNTIRSKIIDIDWKLGYFVMAKKVGFTFSVKKEGEFLKKHISILGAKPFISGLMVEIASEQHGLPTNTRILKYTKDPNFVFFAKEKHRE